MVASWAGLGAAAGKVPKEPCLNLKLSGCNNSELNTLKFNEGRRRVRATAKRSSAFDTSNTAFLTLRLFSRARATACSRLRTSVALVGIPCADAEEVTS